MVDFFDRQVLLIFTHVQVVNQLLEGTARMKREFDLLKKVKIAALKQRGWRLRQLIDGYIRYLREQKNSGPSSSIRDSALTYDDGEELDDDSRISM
jgi:hypothetical protein